MKNTFLFFATLFLALLPVVGQADSYQSSAQEMVNNIASDIALSAEQRTELVQAATHYLEALQAANEQYADEVELVQAKAPLHAAFDQTLQTVLTTEQYAALQQARQQRINSRLQQ